jgi:hypothetical protein
MFQQELPMTDMFLYRTLQTSFLQFSNFSGNYPKKTNQDWLKYKRSQYKNPQVRAAGFLWVLQKHVCHG